MFLRFIYSSFILATISFNSFGGSLATEQTHGHLLLSEEALHLPINEANPGTPHASTKAAREIIHQIVSIVGLQPNFEIVEAKISNAAAINYKGKRFILYDAKFMERLQNSTQTDWAAISILAHEIGHHLNGHTLLAKGDHGPERELEADEFSGFILRHMGATLEEAQKAMQVISSHKASASHPARKDRLNAIAQGFNRADDRILAYSEGQPQAPINLLADVEKETDPEGIQTSYSGQEAILSAVYVSAMPDRKLFLTRSLKLVELKENGKLKVSGELKKVDNSLVIRYFKGRSATEWLISPKGLLYDKDKNLAGYLKKPAVS